MADTTGPGHRGITALAVLSRGLMASIPIPTMGPITDPIMGFPAVIRFRLPLLLRHRPFHPNSEKTSAHEACDGCQPAPTLSPQTQFREDAGTRRASRRDSSGPSPAVCRAETCRHTSAL